MKFSAMKLLLVLCIGTVCVAARAQNGCVNSPECPTAVLAAVGAAGAALYHRLKR